MKVPNPNSDDYQRTLLIILGPTRIPVSKAHTKRRSTSSPNRNQDALIAPLTVLSNNIAGLAAETR
jgi:hypothetical protein